MNIDKKEAEAVLLAGVVLVALLFFFHNIPQDMGDDAISDAISAMLINRAHDTGDSAYKVFEDASKSAGSGGRYLIPNSFKFMGFGTPFWTALLALAQRAFGVTSFWQLFLASLVGFLTVIVTYLAGKAMYGRAVGLLSALLLGSSLFFVIQTRSASGFLAIIPLMTTLVAYLFYTAHKRKDERYLWYSGLALGLALFNGYPPTLLIIPILGFFFLWNFGFRSFFRNFTKIKAIWGRSIDGGEKLVGLREYLFMAVLAVSLFMTLTVAWSMYANVPSLDTFSMIKGPRTMGELGIQSFDELIQWKGSKHFTVTWLPNSREWKIAMEKRFWRIIFLEMDPWESLQGVHGQQQLFGRPMVAPFATVFFFVGLLVMIWRRSMADKLCLVWLAVTKFTFTFPAGFVPRMLMVAAPVIYLTAAVGLMSSFRFLERRIDGASLREEQKLLLRRVPLALLVGGLLLTVYATYGQVFDEYYGMDGNIFNYVGTYEVGRYIAEHTDPKDTLLVLGDISIIPYDAIFLYTSGEPYEVDYWWDDVLLKTGSRGPSGTVAPRLDAWEKKILENRERIIYVFGVGPRYNEIPGWNLYNQVDWHEFKELHPGLQPVKKTYFSNGIPASEVYEVNRSTPRNNYLFVKGGNRDTEFYSSDGSINFMKIRGGGKNPSLAIGNSTFTLPMEVPPSMEVSITFDGNSRILFEPIFDSANYERDVFEKKNLTFKTVGGKSFLEMAGQSAYLIYKIESPFNIERLDIRTNPRVYNDVQRKNAVLAYYSTDGKEYKRIYEVRSSGNNDWAVYRYQITGDAYNNGIYERETYDTVYPESNVVYIKFFFEGYPGEAQLWSIREGDHWLMFDAQVDTSSLERLPVKRGLNTVLTRLAAEGEVTIATYNATIMPRILEAEYLLSSTGHLEGDPRSGLARRTSGSIYPVGYIVYGPGTPLYTPGIYKARFRIAALDTTMTEEIAKLEVVEGSKVLKEMGIKGTDFSKPVEYRDFYLQFTTDGMSNMQFRVYFEKGDGLWVDFIEVIKA